MFSAERSNFDLLLIDNTVSVAVSGINVPTYDFEFRRFFPARSIHDLSEPSPTVARLGAIEDYRSTYDTFLKRNVQLIHDPEEHLRASELEFWHETISDLTPKSIWQDRPLDAADVEATLGWPVFIKGSRQTNRHRRSLHVANNRDEYLKIIEEYRIDPVLSWQKTICREFAHLRLVEDSNPDRLPAAFEFRTFWWYSNLVGFGNYWWEDRDYCPTSKEKNDAIAIAQDAAQRLKLPFVAIDVAQKADGNWIVIEINDAQESGYNGVNRIGMWQNLIDVERQRILG